MNSTYEKKYVESEQEIRTYLDRLQYAIENGSATINLQEKRQVDKDRPKKYTNRYTLSKLFPDEDLVEALKKELIKLTVEEYIETVKDTRYPDRSDMRVFGKKYQEEDVYIKIRVELVSLSYANNSYIFVMSFHFAEKAFNESAFHIGKVEVKIVKKIKSEEKLCLICMTEHEVDTVEVIETEIYKDEEISFVATYEYCSLADEFLEKEEMIKLNDLAMKDAYRRKMDLLTSDEIVKIREKYGVSQKDFSEILGWGKATITRYENHQVQDRAHDDVLRKIDSAPNWFLEMLNRARGRISDKAFDKYYRIANERYKKKRNQYLIDAIQAKYADFDIESFNGGVKLNLNKVVEMINYLAAKVESLHKVKLMKMLWYSDYLHYKRNGVSISGLVYRALPMGAVPEECNLIVELDGVEFDTVIYGEDMVGYRFKPDTGLEIKELTQSEIDALDDVIEQFGDFNTEQIVEKMHNEDAYKYTGSNCIIPFTFAENLSID